MTRRIEAEPEEPGVTSHPSLHITRRAALWLAVTFLVAATVSAGAAPKPLVAKPVEGADSYLEVPYVPADRLTGDPAWDHLTAMNLFVPRDGKGLHPVVLIVHGGGYGGGDMNEGGGQFKPEL